MPSYKSLEVWGCLAKMAILHPKMIKLCSKVLDWISTGYAIKSIAYKFFVNKFDISDIHVDTIIEFSAVEFVESAFPTKRVIPENTWKRKSDNAFEGNTKYDPGRSKRERFINHLVQTLNQ